MLARVAKQLQMYDETMDCWFAIISYSTDKSGLAGNVPPRLPSKLTAMRSSAASARALWITLDRARRDYGVMASAQLPATSGPLLVRDAVAALWPDRFPTASAVRKVVRCGLVLVNGDVARLDRCGVAAATSQCMQVVHRRPCRHGNRTVRIVFFCYRDECLSAVCGEEPPHFQHCRLSSRHRRLVISAA